MTEVAIKAEGISKLYHIGKLNQHTMNLRERLAAAAVAPYRRAMGLLRGNASAAADLDDEFWALQDVSFTIDQGERVAIIGRNGAGKSTLLKVLARITEPTSGTATIRGRVGSLLEVGTGFHPELTGRENIFLNGSILGMSQREVTRKFDSIVGFSEVGQFIDTPVKRYSSGMRVRLAFSVAAHLEPEILIVDEVLSVGDVAFRKKCMQKMQEVASQGATVLVVSHHAQTVTSMCDRAIWLERGQVVKDGPVGETVADYLSQGLGLTCERAWHDDAPGGEVARLKRVAVRAEDAEPADCLDVRANICIETEVEVLVPGHGLVVKNEVFNSDGTHVFSSLDTRNPIWSRQRSMWPKGTYTLRMWVPGNMLQADTYSVDTNIWAWEPDQVQQCYERGTLCFHIMDAMNGDTARGGFVGNVNGVVRPLLRWDMEPDLRPGGSGARCVRTREAQ